jgi:hypothetical protein
MKSVEIESEDELATDSDARRALLRLVNHVYVSPPSAADGEVRDAAANDSESRESNGAGSGQRALLSLSSSLPLLKQAKTFLQQRNHERAMRKRSLAAHAHRRAPHSRRDGDGAQDSRSVRDVPGTTVPAASSPSTQAESVTIGLSLESATPPTALGDVAAAHQYYLRLYLHEAQLLIDAFHAQFLAQVQKAREQKQRQRTEFANSCKHHTIQVTQPPHAHAFLPFS